MKIQTQETANTHSEAADNFNCLADELILFTEEQVRLAQTVSTSISQNYKYTDSHVDIRAPSSEFVFENSVMTNVNCACPAIQRGQGSGFLSEGSS